MSCYNKEWSDKITEITKANKETTLIQANNTLNIYKKLNKGQENKPCNYNDAIKSYEEYINYLENLQGANYDYRGENKRVRNQDKE